MRLSLLRQSADAALTSGDGELGEALLDRAVQQAEAGDERGTDPLDQARVSAEWARRLITRGEPDQADQLLRRACQLFTAAGSERQAAVAMGWIADIAYQRGDYDEAAELQGKRLDVHKQLGDLDGIASASWALAQIDLDREDCQSALPRLTESFQINDRLQRPDGIAAVGMTLGQLLLAAGQPDQARQVLTASQAAAARLGWTGAVQQTSELLNPPQK